MSPHIPPAITELFEWANACLPDLSVEYCEKAVEAATRAGTLTTENNTERFAKQVRWGAINVAYNGQLTLMMNSSNNRTNS